mmetsp:Transcript_7683/g.18438  ORF Transcript_7683/g.18438 Transcript_7683/m.18438 type:complete len:257 (-) Transcript_7683:365-1135(-)
MSRTCRFDLTNRALTTSQNQSREYSPRTFFHSTPQLQLFAPEVFCARRSSRRLRFEASRAWLPSASCRDSSKWPSTCKSSATMALLSGRKAAMTRAVPLSKGSEDSAFSAVKSGRRRMALATSALRAVCKALRPLLSTTFSSVKPLAKRSSQTLALAAKWSTVQPRESTRFGSNWLPLRSSSTDAVASLRTSICKGVRPRLSTAFAESKSGCAKMASTTPAFLAQCSAVCPKPSCKFTDEKLGWARIKRHIFSVLA